MHLNAKTEEIYFTAGGSESDNWALKATALKLINKGKHIITTKIEHHAILHTCEYLEERGYEVTYLDVDENGIVNLMNCRSSNHVRTHPDFCYVCKQRDRNDPANQRNRRDRKRTWILFHTDAVQAFGQVPINVDECNIDMLSASGHKLNGPKGIGFLYIRKGVKIRSFVHGGAQERNVVQEQKMFLES